MHYSRLNIPALLSLLLLLGVRPATAQSPVNTRTTDAVAYNRSGTVFWRVSRPGLPGPSYVLGTMHVLCPDDVGIDPAMTAAFDATRQLVLELDMDAPDFAKQMRQAIRLPWPRTMRRQVKQREFSELRTFFKEKMNQSIWGLVDIEPSVLESMVYSSTLPCTPVSYEEKLMQLAVAQHKETQGLETIEEQVRSMKQTPYEQQMKGLLEAVRTYDSIPTLMQSLVMTYRRRNVEELYRISIDPRYSTEPDGGAADLERRNSNWIPKMQAWMSAQPTFFAVGAGHLGGRTGILQRLREQGYQVEPVLAPVPAR